MPGSLRTIPINQIIRNPANHGERVLGDDEDQALVASIAEHGVLQPINVRQVAPDKYMIVAGERRWWAATEAGRTEIDAIVEGIAEDRVGDALLVENIARRNLSPYEQVTALLAAVRRHRADAERRGAPRISVETLSSQLGFGARQAARLWTICGRLTNDDHQAISASQHLRRSVTVVDLERISNTHVEDRTSIIRRLAEAYEKAESGAAPEKRRPAAPTKGRLFVQDDQRHHIAKCTMVSDTRLKQVHVGLNIRLPPVTDMADVETRRAVAADIRRTLEALLVKIESQDALNDEVVIVPTATYQSLMDVGPASPVAEVDPPLEDPSSSEGMIEDGDQPGEGPARKAG